MSIPEILSPAGDMEKLRTALLYGADAVYLGGTKLNLRAASQGFSYEELEEAVKLAHAQGSKIYFCVNSLLLEDEIRELPALIEEAAGAGVDAFIISDPGGFSCAKKYAPQVPIHMSTQLNTSNSQSVRFWHEQGASRVNLARELDCRHIHTLRQEIPEVEVEIFVHGAMCLAVSGQCLLSAWLNERSANSGKCTQPCRFKYRPHGVSLQVEESKRPGEPIWEVQGGGPQGEVGFDSLWAMEDLCLLPYIPWLASQGISAMKIEGRMKGASYVAHVTDVYRTATDTVARGEAFDYWNFLPELLHNASRTLGTGFFLPEGRRNYQAEAIEKLGYKEKKAPALAAVVLKETETKGTFLIDVKGHWKAEDQVEFMLPGMKRPILSSDEYKLESLKGENLSVINSGQQGLLHLDPRAELARVDIPKGVFLRTVK